MKKSIPLSKIISASVSYCSNLELSCHYIKGKGIDVNKVKVHLLLERVHKSDTMWCRVAHFPGFQFPVGKREILLISRSRKTGKSGKIYKL